MPPSVTLSLAKRLSTERHRRFVGRKFELYCKALILVTFTSICFDAVD
jgi:hypothetical protein